MHRHFVSFAGATLPIGDSKVDVHLVNDLITGP